MSDFAARVAAAVEDVRSPLVVGLDPTFACLPTDLRDRAASSRDAEEVLELYREYLWSVLELCRPYARVTKIQSAFFEALGWRGVRLLSECCSQARSLGYLVLADAKRNDIGHTAGAYARAFLVPDDAEAGPVWDLPDADALTVTPLFGDEGNQPFLDAAVAHGRGVFFIVRTSNPSSAQLQALSLEDGRRFDEAVADLVETYACALLGAGSRYAPVGAVVGATRSEEIAALRARLPHALLLLPGVGAQGAALEPLAQAFDATGGGALIPVSRGILRAHEDALPGEDWKRAIARAAQGYAESLQQLLGAWT